MRIKEIKPLQPHHGHGGRPPTLRVNLKWCYFGLYFIYKKNYWGAFIEGTVIYFMLSKFDFF